MREHRNSDPPGVSIPKGYVWRGQLPHLLLLAALVPGVSAIASPALDGGGFLGVDERRWLLVGVLVPVVHQVAVALVWRSQLGHRWVTRAFGDAGFVLWGAVFLPLLAARPLAVIGLGVADAGSLPIHPRLGLAVGALLLVPAVWTMHSVVKYFGFARAIGGDHFFERYRAMPMVSRGAFAWSPNAMYSFAFLGLWSIALITRSRAALAVALFQHAYIWVHWYCTEQPDCAVLYAPSRHEGEARERS
jgi:hypothetical protein